MDALLALIWKILLTAILVILVIFPFTSVRIHLVYRRKEEKDHLEIGFRLFFGMIRFRTVIPSFHFDQNGILFQPELKTKDTEKPGKKQRFNLQKIRRYLAKINQFRRQIVSFQEIVSEVNRRFLKHVVCEQLIWKSAVGTGDAASTGVVTGIFWGIKSTLIGFAGSYIRWQEAPRLDIEPLFHSEKIETTLDSIIRFRVGHAILAVIHLLIRMIRNSKGGEGNWQSTRFKA
ncbi:MAG: DUF2953 domain-containing protein [Firmicutes bacterium]|uniref:DUF2953 domain-containing protein n=1 Tax=Melghirimyces thermohalophilus TaxID=1236220 RepID=UPI000B85FCFA|nr:DUF2953 domain-containing protein [Melghirimyces thermohalophilus]MDA8352033.1 DUF2953 domain-containing protein [Bacillota bacterium]